VIATPYSLVLSAIPWSLFGTLTFSAQASTDKALRECLRWLRWVAHISGVSYRNLVFVVRVEAGERFGRIHLHVLIVVPDEVVSYFVVRSGFVPRAHREWRLGMTKFRRVAVTDDPAVPYCLKETSGADEYEVGKTSRAPQIVLSHGARRVACARKR